MTTEELAAFLDDKASRGTGATAPEMYRNIATRLRELDAVVTAARRAVQAWFTHPDPHDGPRCYREERDAMEVLRDCVSKHYALDAASGGG